MAKYNIVELNVENGNLPDLNEKSEAEKQALRLQNAIYVYRSSQTKKLYVGQTMHFLERHKQHYSGKEEKFDQAHFNQAMVIFSRYFHRSALDDVESQLITYFAADNQGQSSSSIGYDEGEVINRTSGNTVNDYMERENVATDVVLRLWEKEFYPRGWAKTKILDDLRTRSLVKYSPIKVLTAEQSELIREIIYNRNRSYVIHGDAGTGKTVLLTHLVASLYKECPEVKIGVVVQPNWEKTCIDIFRVFGMNTDRLTISTSTKLIKTKESYDIIIVDDGDIIGLNQKSA